MASKTIYLTFDDGPSGHTGQLLALLEQYRAKATFFVLGEQIVQYEEAFRQIHAAGHAIGVHGYCHDYDKVYQSPEAFWEDHMCARRLIERLTGGSPCLMRFQGGSSNTVSRRYCPGIMTALAAQAAERGYRYQDWNIHPDDVSKTHSAAEMLDIIKADLDKDPAVILLHDVDWLPENLELTDRLLHDLTAEGCTFAALSKDVPQVLHRISN